MGGARLWAICAASLLCGAPALFVGACSSTPLPPTLLSAEEHERARRYPEALAAYDRAATDCRNPRDCVRAALGKAELLERLDRAREAYAAHDRIRADARAHAQIQARALYRMGDLLVEKLGDPASGQRLLWEVIERFPGEAAADRALATLVRTARRRDALPALVARLDQLEPRLRAHPIGEQLAYAAAEIVEKSDEAAGLARYRALAEHYPRGTRIDDALWRTGQLLQRKGDTDGALAAYQRLVGRFERSLIVGSYNSVWMDDAQLASAEIYLKDKRDPERAIQAAQTLFKLFPDSMLRPAAQWVVAEAELARGQTARACRALDELRTRFPDSKLVRRAVKKQRELNCAVTP